MRRISVVTAVGLAGLLVGLGLLFLASGTASKVGFVVALVAVLYLVVGLIPAALLPVGSGLMMRGARPLRGVVAEPDPELVDANPAPSDAAWEREALLRGELGKQRERRDVAGSAPD